jgi:hypothetical protein
MLYNCPFYGNDFSMFLCSYISFESFFVNNAHNSQIFIYLILIFLNSTLNSLQNNHIVWGLANPPLHNNE